MTLKEAKEKIAELERRLVESDTKFLNTLDEKLKLESQVELLKDMIMEVLHG